MSMPTKKFAALYETGEGFAVTAESDDLKTLYANLRKDGTYSSYVIIKVLDDPEMELAKEIQSGFWKEPTEPIEKEFRKE